VRGIGGTIDTTDGRLRRTDPQDWGFIDRARRLAAATDGPIQNADDLRARLGLSPGATDAELLAHAYRRYGRRLPEYLEGAFGIAVWDGRRGGLLLARDRLGVRPIFYTKRRGRFAFASEARWLLEAGLVERVLDPEWLDAYLAFGYSPDRAVVRDARVLPPGHWLTLTADGNGEGVTVEPYWRAADHVAAGPAPPDPAAALRETLARAVADAIDRDRPVGVLLSSGLDSASVLALAVEAVGAPVPAFTLGFAERSYDERHGAARTARHLGCPHHRFRIEEHVADLPGRLASLYDQPLADTACLSQYAISKVAARHVPVVLSGDGGDELFAGYHVYRAELAHAWYGRLPAAVRTSLVEDTLLRARPRREKFGPANLARLWVEGARRPAACRHMRWLAFFGPEERRAILTPEAAEVVPIGAAEGAVAKRFEDLVSLAQCQCVDLVHSLPGTMLPKVDGPARRFGLAVRSPILDRRVVELVGPWPVRLKGGLRGGKRLLRRAMARDLPRRTGRAKRGFSVPVKTYLRGPWREWMRDTLAADRSGLFRREAIDRMVADHLAGRQEHGRQLWALLVLLTYLDAHRLRL